LHTDDGDEWLNVGSVKLFADGALGPQTAAMLTPYENSENIGTLLMKQSEIEEIGEFAVSNGFALAIHAIGDLANHVVLNAYQTIRHIEQSHNFPHYRHRIEHVQIIDPKDLPRFAQLEIIASVQPVHAPSDMAMADKYLGSRAKNAYAYQAMLDSHAELVCGSDAPVEPANPFQGIHAAITRCRTNGQPGETGWHPEQRLTLQDALAGFSSKPAEISNRGTRLGKITVGCKADFLILEEDPFMIEPQLVSEIKPLATFIEGKRVFQSETADADY
jgi:predicted amidohydrolase YtcJ